jgi:hypothetical protein
MIVTGGSGIPNYSMKVKVSLYDSNWWIWHFELQYEAEGEPL